MKLKYLIAALLISFSFSSCFKEQELNIFPDDQAYVAFFGESITISEAEDDVEKMKIPVFVAAHKGSSVTVNFSISTEGLENPAIEGVDYTVGNTNNQLTFPERVGVEPVVIEPIDVEGRDRNKYLYVIITAASGDISVGEIGFDTCLVRISDNEHPLNFITGKYKFNGTSFYAANNEEYEIEITTDEKDENDQKIILQNFYRGGKDFSVKVVYDNHEMTEIITIDAEQSLGSIDGELGAYLYKVTLSENDFTLATEEEIKGIVIKKGNTDDIDYIDFEPFCVVSMDETKETGYYNNVFTEIRLTKIEN